jgi:diguanylate cyclase (GGDEF)-like protein
MRRLVQELLHFFHTRRRVHHVYYLLALFDVATVTIGLVVTHLVVGTLSQTVQSHLDWSAIHTKVVELRAVAGRIIAPGNDVFATRDPNAEMHRFGDAIEAFAPAYSAVVRAAASEIEAQAWVEFRQALGQIEIEVSELTYKTQVLLQEYAAGNIEAAEALMAAMNRNYGDALIAIEAAGEKLRNVESVIAQKRLDDTQSYRYFELALAGLIGIMIVFVTLYGRKVSRHFERQNMRLARFNSELESVIFERTRELVASQKETARQREELRVRNEHFDIAVNNMNRGLALFDAGQRLVVANQRYHQMYDLGADAVKPGTQFLEILKARVAKGHFAGESPDAYFAESLAGASRSITTSHTFSLNDGRIVEVGHNPTPEGGWVETCDDITERRRMEQQIVHLAHHDALTGLPNRRKLHQELEGLVKRASRGETFAVLCLDLDHFKHVNDTLGHSVGDRLLQAVAARLNGQVRNCDLVARLGGDEFAVIQVLAEQPNGAAVLASRIIEEICVPYEIDGHHLVISTSIGIAIAPMDGQDADAILKNADLALYRAKLEGKATYRLFEPEMDARAKVRRQLELDLRKAVLCEEFELFYQPLVDACTSRILGFEALLRWRHRERGLVPPAEFIPLAEEIGLMGEIGAWVLKMACKEAMNWPPTCRVAVNVSPAQFRSRQLDIDVHEALSASGLKPDRLELEITETVLLENTESTLVVLTRLREGGVRIAMDDFGTGYSSLRYLHSFPFDKIKIDRSFTQAATTSASSMAIVKAVLGLGRNLGVSTTAEGVETDEQFKYLRDAGCVEVQGYLFSRPIPAEQVPALLEQQAHRANRAA